MTELFTRDTVIPAETITGIIKNDGRTYKMQAGMAHPGDTEEDPTVVRMLAKVKEQGGMSFAQAQGIIHAADLTQEDTYLARSLIEHALWKAAGGEDNVDPELVHFIDSDRRDRANYAAAGEMIRRFHQSGGRF